MRRIVLGLAVMVTAPVWAQQAPFCVATNGGTQCFYYNLSACQQAARGMNGMCTVNPQQSAPARKPYDINSAIQHPDIIQSGIRAAEDGARQRQANEEHQATMRLIEAQTRAQQQTSTVRPETNDGYWVLYKCPGSDGVAKFSGVPEVGCVVSSVTAY